MIRFLTSFLILLGGTLWVSVSAYSDVVGSFEFSMALFPQSKSVEATRFDVDLELNLQAAVTVGDLVTLGTHSFVSILGTETALLSLDVNLGVVFAFYEFIFSIPYYSIDGSGDEVTIIPTTDPGGDPNKSALFVKNRATLGTNIAGFTIENLSIYEDVDFPVFFSNAKMIYDGNSRDGIIGNTVPTFAFGDLITISGQTKEGLLFRNRVGVCLLDQINHVRRWSGRWVVNPFCGDRTISPPHFSFDFFEFSASNFNLFGTNLSLEVLWTKDINLNFTLHTSIFDIINLQVLGGINISDPTNSSLSTLVKTPFLTVFVQDDLLDLDVDVALLDAGLTLNPNINPTNFQIQLLHDSKMNKTSIDTELSISRFSQAVTFSTKVRFESQFSSADLAWKSLTGNFRSRLGVAVFGITVAFTNTGFDHAQFVFGLAI